ncbi:MAG: helix-turn-helix domain-containing protein [Mesorhizobium sp.]|nr:helix-turn-helix domain-containing protein [Mesorhizobium sp.]
MGDRLNDDPETTATGGTWDYDFMSEQEAADLLGITRRRLEYLRATGRITYYKMGPPRYDRKDVEEFRAAEAEEKAESARWKAEWDARAAEKRAAREARRQSK